MNEEIMNVEEVMDEEVMVENHGSDLGKGVLVGAGIVGAGFALYKLGKKLATKFKKKETEVEIVVEQPKDSDADDDKNDKPKKK